MPERIQLKRSKGWRKPQGAVVVSRPSRWGNPYRAGDMCLVSPVLPFPMPTARTEEGPAGPKMDAVRCRDAAQAVEWYRQWIAAAVSVRAAWPLDLRLLEGRDLGCWCPLDQPCHADVLLELANAPAPSVGGVTSRETRDE